MKDKILSRTTNIIAIVLLVISVLLVGLVYLGGSSESVVTAGGDELNVPQWTDTLIYWCYALLVATAGVMVIFAISQIEN